MCQVRFLFSSLTVFVEEIGREFKTVAREGLVAFAILNKFIELEHLGFKEINLLPVAEATISSLVT